jgi:ribonucleoside-diphosphate reductase alpha chain
MVVNLTSFVKDPFTSNANFDFEEFYQTVFKAQRLMDDLIDLELESIDKIITKIKEDQQPENVKKIELDLWRKIERAAWRGRRTGLGITGLGDCLAALNIQYGSDESVKMTEEIYRYLGMGAHASSLIMAKERGAFPEFDYSKEENHQYLKKMIANASEKISNAEHLWQNSGRRNIALTTTAPVGSVSCLTQTTSGIEPAFLLSYKRRRKITEGDFESKVDFVDELGDRWQEYTVYHHWFKKWMDTTGLEDEKLSPYFGGTANDIDWVKSVDIQAAAQKFIDHSISKTCNLPNSATKELVSDVYMRAWKTGCKGFTVYRDGCRNGVLVSNEEKPKETSSQENLHRTSPKRPKELECDIHHAKIKDDVGIYRNWLVIVGLLEGKPYEVFCGVRENIEIPRKYKKGVLAKNGKKDGVATYNLLVPVGDDENLVFKDIMNIFDNPTQGSFTRTLSLALRHGVPVQYVVEQLQKDKYSDMFSFSKIIARVLKGYILDGTKASSEKSCPSCNSHDLVYQEGCVTCASCGWSKCN